MKISLSRSRHKAYLLLTQHQKIYLKIAISRFSFYAILCDQKLLISYLSILIMFNIYLYIFLFIYLLSIYLDGFFIEAGARDFQDQSTSLYFELNYNWTVSIIFLASEFFRKRCVVCREFLAFINSQGLLERVSVMLMFSSQ